MRGKFYIGIVDNLGLDNILELELKSPIEMLKIRARVNSHRDAEFFTAQISDNIFNEIITHQKKGHNQKAKKILFSDAIYLSLRQESRLNTEMFKQEGLEWYHKMHMIEEL